MGSAFGWLCRAVYGFYMYIYIYIYIYIYVFIYLDLYLYHIFLPWECRDSVEIGQKDLRLGSLGARESSSSSTREFLAEWFGVLRAKGS